MLATREIVNVLISSLIDLTPFLDVGIAKSVPYTTFFHRPFTSYGELILNVAHM